MAAQLPAEATLRSPAATSALARRWSRFWREPLLHFTVLGAALFALDTYLLQQQDDPMTIVVSRSVSDEARKLFRDSSQREPTAAELKALTERWLHNEILYREGLALQVDKGDTMIRDRVIFKSLMVVQTGLKPPPVNDALLRQWFEANRSKYDEPARFDFHEAVMPAGTAPAALQALVQQLNSGSGGEAQAGLRVFKARPQDNLVLSYGADFARALAAAPAGEWRVLDSREGPRVVRLDALAAPKPAVFEDLRNTLLPDWTDATMAELRTQAVRERGQKYRVRYEGLEGAAP